MDALVVVTLGIFIVGLVFAAGVNHQRIRALEEWRLEMKGDLLRFEGKLDEIARLVRLGE
jgi:hypothetical protein